MCYHVLNRGNGRNEVFHKEGDYAAFLKLLGEASERVPMRLLAYCLMPNHWHLLIETPQANVTAFMQQFNTSYTTDFNRVHQRTGHLYAGRYKAKLVEGEAYLLTLTR